MTRSLDVLLVESHDGLGDTAATRLDRAGHRVHRCFEPGTDGFPCKGVTDQRGCALDSGVDVALVVRGGVAPRATNLEHGVSCAIRAGVPVVEDGTDLLDPFGPWVDHRVDDDVVATCETAVQAADEAIGEVVRGGIADRLAAAGGDPATCRCHVARDGGCLHLTIQLSEPADAATAQALGVRALDALRALPRLRTEKVDVAVTPLQA